MLSYETLFFEINLKCPSCGHEFIATKTKAKVKENMPIGYETYLMPIYPHELANPLSYEIDVCPKCYYAAFHMDFTSEEQLPAVVNLVKTFEKEIKSISHEINFNIKFRTYEMARLSYIIAVFLCEKENKKDLIKIGKCFTRIAWYSKALNENDFYRTALKRALDIYLEAYGEIDDVSISATLLYLIGVIYIELGELEAALPFINKLNADENARNMPALKQRIEEAVVLLREKLKKIDNETKNMNDDRKKEARKKRMEENKVKVFKEPFGIELKKPDKSKLEIRETIKKNDENELKLSDKPKILIVDDSRIIIAGLRGMLESTFDVVGTALNGNDAINLTASLKPEIITLDLEMPGLSGLETLVKIRAFDKNVKIVMLTSTGDAKMVYHTLKNGANSYMLKPPHKEKLIELINSLLNDKHKEL